MVKKPAGGGVEREIGLVRRLTKACMVVIPFSSSNSLIGDEDAIGIGANKKLVIGAISENEPLAFVVPNTGSEARFKGFNC